MMKISINIKETFQCATRHFNLKSSNGFKIPSVGLIHSWKVINQDEKVYYPFLIIGNFELDLKRLLPETKDIISIGELRKYIRGIDYPETDEQVHLLQLEDFMCGQQIKSIQYYHGVSTCDLFHSIFTGDLNVYLEIRDDKNQLIDEEFQIEETYWEKQVPKNLINENRNENNN